MVRRVVLAALVVLAGCGASGGGTDAAPLRATAAPATLDTDTRTALGFDERRADTPRLNTSVTARIEGDVTMQTTRDVRATTARRVYARSTTDGPVVVALYVVPGVRPFENADLRKNPAAGLSPAALATRSQTVYAALHDASRDGERSATLLGNRTTLTRARATATKNGERREVTVVVGTVAHRGDYVSVVLVWPRGTDPSLGRLLEGVRHENG